MEGQIVPLPREIRKGAPLMTRERNIDLSRRGFRFRFGFLFPITVKAER